MTPPLRVRAAAPDPQLRALLPGAQFIDAYSVVVPGPLDARRAAERMFGRSPGWVAALLWVRDGVMGRLGVKTTRQARAAGSVGIFPVVSESAERLVAGFDDRHLDFRVIVGVAAEGDSVRVTATTVVKTHNSLGRAYLAAIMPFHRLIARSAVEQARG